LPTFSVRVSERQAAHFDAAAAAKGGRSARLRQLIEAEGCGAPAAGSSSADPRNGGRFLVRLRAGDAEAVRREAQEMCLSPSGWIAALVARRVAGRPRLPPRQAAALLGVAAEVHRIGVNANQIARALNTAVAGGRGLELEVAAIEAFRRELRAGLVGLHAAFEGNLAYWDAER
jgi:hypothetical protein